MGKQSYQPASHTYVLLHSGSFCSQYCQAEQAAACIRALPVGHAVWAPGFSTMPLCCLIETVTAYAPLTSWSISGPTWAVRCCPLPACWATSSTTDTPAAASALAVRCLACSCRLFSSAQVRQQCQRPSCPLQQNQAHSGYGRWSPSQQWVLAGLANHRSASNLELVSGSWHQAAL